MNITCRKHLDEFVALYNPAKPCGGVVGLRDSLVCVCGGAYVQQSLGMAKLKGQWTRNGDY